MKFLNRLAALIAPAVIILGLSSVCNAGDGLPSWVRHFERFLGNIVYGKPFNDGENYFIEVSLNEQWYEYGFNKAVLRYVRLAKEEIRPGYHGLLEIHPIYQFQSIAITTTYGAYLMMLGHYIVNDFPPDKVIKIPGVERRHFWNDREGVMFMIQGYNPERYAIGFLNDTKRIDIYSPSPLIPVLVPPELVNRTSNEDMTKEDLEFASLLFITSAFGVNYEID